jgi:hypothetical protein
MELLQAVMAVCAVVTLALKLQKLWKRRVK